MKVAVMKQQNHDKSIKGTLASAALSRAVINTTNRFIYPFAGVISRGLGIPLTAVTSVIAINQATAMLGLFTAHIGDRSGYKKMMLTGLFLLASGMLLAGAVPLYYTLVIALFLSGFAKNLFDPAIQAYIGKRVPFHRRGFAVGVLEISWSAATLVGIPVCGFLIDGLGWRSPFFALSALAMLCFGLILLFVTNDAQEKGDQPAPPNFFHALGDVAKNRRAMGISLATFCASFANDNLFVIYGPWLEETFHLSVVALGMGTAVIGVAELCGSSGIALFADRIGIKRAILAGFMGAFLSFGIIPTIGANSLVGALAGLFAIFFTFEFSIVAVISLCTEVIASSRATMMALFFAAGGVGRVAGAASGAVIWQASGMTGVCIISALLNLMAFCALVWGLKGWRSENG